MTKKIIKKKKLKRTKGREGLFTVNTLTLDGMEAGELKLMVADMNAQADPLYLAERYEQAAISYLESFGYEYNTSGQKTITVPREERERRLKAREDLLRNPPAGSGLKPTKVSLSIDDIEKEDVVCWLNYLRVESKKQGKHGIRYALDVISITTKIKNGLKKGDYNHLFNLAMKLTNCFSIMVTAQYEDKICAGVSRTEAGSKAKSETAAEKRRVAIELAEKYRNRKRSNPHNKITATELYKHVANELTKEFDAGQKPVHPDTVKKYLQEYLSESPLKK